jgi:hypothetical protein
MKIVTRPLLSALVCGTLSLTVALSSNSVSAAPGAGSRSM